MTPPRATITKVGWVSCRHLQTHSFKRFGGSTDKGSPHVRADNTYCTYPTFVGAVPTTKERDGGGRRRNGQERGPGKAGDGRGWPGMACKGQGRQGRMAPTTGCHNRVTGAVRGRGGTPNRTCLECIRKYWPCFACFYAVHGCGISTLLLPTPMRLPSQPCLRKLLLLNVSRCVDRHGCSVHMRDSRKSRPSPSCSGGGFRFRLSE